MWYLQQQNQSSRAQFYHLSVFSSLIPFITFILTGFLLLDKSQGFWVIHSVPLFPPSPEDGYGYPSSGESFGQTAICITFKYDQFTEIGMKNFSLRRPLSHHTSLIAFLEVSPQKFLVLDLFCDVGKPRGAWKEHSWLQLRLSKDFLCESGKFTLPLCSHLLVGVYQDNNSHKCTSRVNSVHANRMLWKYKVGWLTIFISNSSVSNSHLQL